MFSTPRLISLPTLLPRKAVAIQVAVDAVILSLEDGPAVCAPLLSAIHNSIMRSHRPRAIIVVVVAAGDIYSARSGSPLI